MTTAPPKKKFINDPEALLKTLKRLRKANDNVTYRTSGGLRIMLRNEPDDDDGPGNISFDVSVVIEDELPSVEKAFRNEIDIMDDESGCIVIEEYSFAPDDVDSLQEAVNFLNQVDLWTICPCGEYLIKDAPEGMCYYCEMMTCPNKEDPDVFCPICHESGHPRWMITTTCCKQKMHRKCKETCVSSSEMRLQDAQCPMCRAPWD
jgi:hypothetical protein